MKPRTLLAIAGLTLLTACAGKERTELMTYHGYTEAKEPGATLYVLDGKEIQGDTSFKKKFKGEREYWVTHTEPNFWNPWGKIKSVAPADSSTQTREKKITLQN